ncbi:unnamed protein product [Linum tenue]|nr:unnamed protein product [Linum tenue]CAI0411448.1 unnamed protein product [Linum tenue]
MTQLVR